MRKRRLAYWLVLAVLAVFLFFFSQPFFLWALAVLGVLALVVAVLLRQDAKKLTLRLEVRSGGREGSQVPLTIVVRPRGRILVSRCMEVDLSIENLMFGSVRSRKLHLRLGRGEQRYQIPADLSGQGWELLEACGRKRGFLISGGEVDTERMAKILLDEFRSGKLGRFTLELP